MLYNEGQAENDKPEFVVITSGMLNKISKFVTGVTADKVTIKSVIEDNDYRIKDQQTRLRMSDHLTHQRHPLTGCTVLTNRRLDVAGRNQLLSKIQNIFKEL